MTKAVTLAELADQNVLSVDGANNRVGIASTQPATTLDVDGTVTATSFSGNITGTAATFTGNVTVDRLGVGLNNPAVPLHMFGSYPTLKIQNSATAQYASASIDLQGPAGDERYTKILHGNSNTGGTETYFQIEQYDGSGSYVKQIASYNYQNDYWNFLPAGTERLRVNTGGIDVTGHTETDTLNVTGVATFTGNVTVGGTLTYEDVTSVDSIGIITARNGLQVTSGLVGIGTDSNLTAKLTVGNIENSSVTDKGAIAFKTLASSGGVGESAIYLEEQSGSEGWYLKVNSSGDLQFNDSGISDRITFQDGGGVGIGTDNPTTKLDVLGGFRFAGEALENVNITAGTLLANQDINLTNGMVHYFTSNETGISTANIRIDGSTSLDSTMKTGNTAAVTILTTPNNAGYSTCVNIDGSYNVVQWLGGAAPSAGGASGIDVYSYQIIKTGSATFTVLGNVSNFA